MPDSIYARGETQLSTTLKRVAEKLKRRGMLNFDF